MDGSYTSTTSPLDATASRIASYENGQLPLDPQSMHNEGEFPDDVFSDKYNPRENTPPLPEIQRLQAELANDLPDDAPDGFDSCLGSKYDFRVAARQNQRMPLTWLDQDQSGNYDPTCESRRRLPMPCLKRKRQRPEHADDGTPKRPRFYSWKQGRTIGQELRIALKFKSETGQAWLQSRGSALDNQPKLFWYDDKNDDGPVYWSDAMEATFTDSEHLDSGHYKLRRRRRRGFRDLNTFGGCGEPDLTNITLGHPAARGCKGCLALGVWCPLLQEGSKYPCDTCMEDEIDCELVTEPAKKRRCESCLRRRIPCSYVHETSDHTKPCGHCAKDGQKCVAGPASGRTRTGPSLDQVFTQKPKEDPSTRARSTMKGCNQCSLAKKWCSLKNKNPTLPCTYCKDNGMSCTFESLRRRAVQKKPKESGNDPCNTKAIGPEGIKEAPLGMGQSKAIRTRLAHPINLNYEPLGNDPIPPCHWCDDLIYGLLGLGEIEVEVKIPDDDGQGYLEVGNGHVAAGYSPSRMCVSCTTDRLSILICKGHDIRPIEGMDPDTFNFRSNLEWLEPGKAWSAPFAWCSVCPAPAFFACSTKDSIRGEVADLGMDDVGCGLVLCESCAVSLVNDHDSTLEGLLDKLKMEEEEGGFNIRADSEFLHPKGELMRRMGAI